jgi:hypothetical protein
MLPSIIGSRVAAFECEAMSVMQYRNPNASNRISADIRSRGR